MMHFAMFLTLRCTLHRFSSPDFREAFNEQGNKENVKLIIKKLASDTHEKKEKYIQKQRKNKIYIGNTVGILKPKKKCTHSVEKALNMRTDIRKKKKKNRTDGRPKTGKKQCGPVLVSLLALFLLWNFLFWSLKEEVHRQISKEQVKKELKGATKKNEQLQKHRVRGEGAPPTAGAIGWCCFYDWP